MRNLRGDLFAPSSERILHLATEDGVTVEDSDVESNTVTYPANSHKKKYGRCVINIFCYRAILNSTINCSLTYPKIYSSLFDTQLDELFPIQISQ